MYGGIAVERGATARMLVDPQGDYTNTLISGVPHLSRQRRGQPTREGPARGYWLGVQGRLYAPTRQSPNSTKRGSDPVSNAAAAVFSASGVTSGQVPVSIRSARISTITLLSAAMNSQCPVP